jgi:hypothetical protein
MALVLVSIALDAVTAMRVRAEVVKVVTPASTKDVEGSDFATPAATPIRIQHLILASDFAGLPAENRLLVSFNFRADRRQTVPVDWGSGAERIWMSTTDKSALTSVFEQNHGANKTLVHDGPISYPLLGSGPPGGPRDIADGLPLQTPFFYDPSQGNLLVDRLVFSTDPSPRADIDTLFTNQNLILLNNTDPNAASGALGTLPAVLQFQFVPEPSTFVLAAIALAGVAVWRRIRARA